MTVAYQAGVLFSIDRKPRVAIEYSLLRDPADMHGESVKNHLISGPVQFLGG